MVGAGWVDDGLKSQDDDEEEEEEAALTREVVEFIWMLDVGLGRVARVQNREGFSFPVTASCLCGFESCGVGFVSEWTWSSPRKGGRGWLLHR